MKIQEKNLNGELVEMRYYGDDRKMRAYKTNQVRFRLLPRGGEPLLILQLEEVVEVQKSGRNGVYWTRIDGTYWRDAVLEDLSVMDISKLTVTREGGEMPVCFRPFKPWWGKWMLVLQIMQGGGNWADAKMNDLLFKEGKILGGVGLISR